jgi:hypothetical protein
MRLVPETQVMKNFFSDVGLVYKGDDAHLYLAFFDNKRICFINFSNEVGPALFNSLDNSVALISLISAFCGIFFSFGSRYVTVVINGIQKPRIV